MGGILFIIYALFLARMRFPRPQADAGGLTPSLSTAWRGGRGGGEERKSAGAFNWAAMRAAMLDLALLRWALILPLLEVPLNAFVVLYFHDVVGLTNVAASSTLLILIISSLVGKALLPWLLRYTTGMRLLKVGVWIGIASFAAFLLVPVKCQ